MKSSTTTFMRLWGILIQGDWGPLTFYTATDGGVVAFLKAPPRCPPTYNQIANRWKWQQIADLWNSLPIPSRDIWETLSKRANLRITGWNLFTYYQMRRDLAAVQTLQHQTGIFFEIPALLNLTDYPG